MIDYLIKLFIACAALGTTVFIAGVCLQLWRERREVTSWPYVDKEPPERIFLGLDKEHTGRVSVTWWLWPIGKGDIGYIRKDIVDERIKGLNLVIERLGGGKNGQRNPS